MTLGWDEGRVAELICTFSGDRGERRTRASGYRIIADKVLTCAHAVLGAETILVRFSAGTAEHPSADEWTVTAESPILLGHDLAILPIDPTKDPEQRPVYAPAYGWVIPGLVHPAAMAVGFPGGQVREEGSPTTGKSLPYRDSKQATGALNPLSGLKQDTWEFAVTNRLPGTDENETSSWGGMSGAAAWVDGHLVGVVTEDVHPGLANTLTVVPITAPWKAPPPQLDTPLTEIFGGEDPADWANVGIASSLQKVPAHHHKRARKFVPAEGLKGREVELNQMTAFCHQDAEPGYWWWRAKPWSGKTALMATFTVHAPPDLSVASFFLNAQDENRRTRDKFLDAILPQLDAIAGRPHPSALTKGAEEESFQEVLEETAKICQEHRIRLVVLIDALDEEDSDPETRPSISSLLPTTTDGLRIIVSSRPNPDIPGLPRRHPLKTPAVRHDLTESPYAAEVRERAIATLTHLARANSLEWRIVALIAVAGSGLSAQECARILGVRTLDVQHAMSRSSLLIGQDRYFVNDEPETVYILGHATLPDFTKELLEETGIREYQQRITQWADSYSAAGWPPDTPRFLLTTGYTAFLATTQDLDRLTRLALDHTRQVQLLALSGSTLQAYEDIRRAEQANLDSENPDVLRALRLCLNRTQIENLASQIPPKLPAVYARIGQHRRALTLAKSITNSWDRDRGLGLVATTQVTAGHYAEALVTTREITEPRDRTQALVQVATAQAITGHEAEALTAAREITDPESRAWVLAAVAAVQATAGHDPMPLLAQALAAAREIADPDERAQALTKVATAQAAAGQDPMPLLAQVLATAREITDSENRARALAAVATAQASAGHDPMPLLAQALTTARGITDPSDRDRTLPTVAAAQAGAGRYAEALATAREIDVSWDRARALREVATAQAGAGRYAEALATAREITNPWAASGL